MTTLKTNISLTKRKWNGEKYVNDPDGAKRLSATLAQLLKISATDLRLPLTSTDSSKE